MKAAASAEGDGGFGSSGARTAKGVAASLVMLGVLCGRYSSCRLTIAASLTDADVGVERGVARRAREVLVLPVRNVDVRALVDVALGQTEVDDVHQVALLPEAHEEVVRLDVSVYQVSRVGVLDTCDLPEEDVV